MAVSRVYTVVFTGVSVTLAQDLFFILAPSTMAFRLMAFEISADAASAAAAAIRLSIKRVPATVTAGTGGTAPTPQPVVDTDVASLITARVNDMTTRATSGGTITTLWSSSINVLSGYQFLPTPDFQFSFKPSSACVIGMETAPGAATVFDGVAVIQEVF